MPDSKTPDSEYERATIAVQRGWVSREQVAAAVKSREADPGSTLLAHLPLTARQLEELQTVGPEAATILAGAAERNYPTPPPDVAGAMKDPKSRVGRFVLVNLLGQGGMGMVFRGWEPQLRQWVAIKILRFSGDDLARAYFKREAQTAAGLDHPNIAKIYEVGEHEGQPYIAMQFIDGESLAAAKKGMKPEAKAETVRKIADAVRYAHGKGVIHRDLKPANVMIDRNGQPYVMDFGLAKEMPAAGGPAESIAGSNTVLGTPQYMAPEQAKGKADPQSDVYGIGAILYELVTGRPPFTGETPSDVVVQVLNGELVWPRKLSPSTPPDLEAIIIRALEKEQRQRYADVTQLIEDLDAFLQKNPLRHARRPTIGYVLGKKIRKQPRLWALTGALLLTLGVGAVVTTHGLVQARREAERRTQVEGASWLADLESRRKMTEQKDAAARKEAAIQKLATLWLTIVERKQEMRSGSAPYETARVSLEKALENVNTYVVEWPDQPQGYYVRARGEKYLGDLDKAEADARKTTELEPSFRPGWALLAMIEVEKTYYHRLSTPETQEDHALAMKALFDAAAEAMARGWESGKEEEEAARWGLAWSREDRVALQLSRALEANIVRKDRAEAIRLLEEGVSEYKAEEYLSELALLNSDLDKRLALQTQTLQLAPGYGWAHLQRGSTRLTKKDYDGAIADLTRAAALLKRYPEVYHNLGSSRKGKGDLEGALRDYTRAIEIDPKYADGYVARASVRKELGDPEGALAEYAKAIEVKPGHLSAYYFRAGLKDERGDSDGAIADCDRALAIDRNYANAYYMRGNAKAHKRNWGGALADYDQAIALKRGFNEAYNNRAVAKYHRGDLDGSIEDCDRSIAAKKDNPSAFCMRARSRLRKGDLDGAIADCDQALALKKDLAEAYEFRADARVRKGDADGAIADADQMLALKKDNAPSYVIRARAHAWKGNWEESIADNSRAIALVPKDALPWHNRGCAQYNLRRWNEALSDFKKSCDIDSRVQPYSRLRVWILRARLGDRDAATAELRAYVDGRKSADAKDWWPTIAGFILGSISESDFLTAAGSGDTREEKGRRCEALFYSGIVRLLERNAAAAEHHFRKALETDMRSFTEYGSAESELKALRER